MVMVCWLLKCGDGFPAHQLYCCLLLWIQLCSQYLHEVNSCYSTTGLCYSNIRSDSNAGGAGAGSQLWKLLCALVLQERSRKNLFMSYLGFKKCPFQDFFSFSLSKTYVNFKGKNSTSTDECCQTTYRVKFQCTNVSIVYYIWCSCCHTKYVFFYTQGSEIVSFISTLFWQSPNTSGHNSTSEKEDISLSNPFFNSLQ